MVWAADHCCDLAGHPGRSDLFRYPEFHWLRGIADHSFFKIRRKDPDPSGSRGLSDTICSDLSYSERLSADRGRNLTSTG